MHVVSVLTGCSRRRDLSTGCQFCPKVQNTCRSVGQSKIGTVNGGESSSDVEKNVEGGVLDGAEVVEVEQKDAERDVVH